MASIINATTSSGVAVSGDTSGVLQLATNGGTTAVTIDTSQNVGIGTTSPANKLHVKGTWTVNEGQFQIDADSGQQFSGMTIQNNGTYKALFYNDNSNSWTFLSTASGSNQPLLFGTNESERMRINATAPVLCLAGGNTSATGTGIAFPATQSASSDANTLDDYEEGTFTPTLTASGAIAGFTYQQQAGNYVKIGKTVFFCLEVQITGLAGGSSGNLRISNLPFTASSTPAYTAVSLAYATQTGGTTPNVSMVASGQTYMLFWNCSGGSATGIGFGSLSAFDYYVAGSYTTT